MTEASHQMTSNPLPKHGPHKPGEISLHIPYTSMSLLPCSPFTLPLGPRLQQQLWTMELSVLTRHEETWHEKRLLWTAGTVGRAQGTVKVTILDEKNQELPMGKIGEVCIRGPNVTKGYINRPEANEEAFAGSCQTPVLMSQSAQCRHVPTYAASLDQDTPPSAPARLSPLQVARGASCYHGRIFAGWRVLISAAIRHPHVLLWAKPGQS